MLNDQFLEIRFYTFLIQIIVSVTSNDTITVKGKVRPRTGHEGSEG